MGTKKNSKKELNVLVLTPFIDGTTKGKGEVKEGKLNMLSLPVHKVYHINEDPDDIPNINPLIGENFKSLIIDLRKLDEHIDKVPFIETMLFVIRNEKPLKKMKIAFLGNKEDIKKHFNIYDENIQFFNNLAKAAITLN